MQLQKVNSTLLQNECVKECLWLKNIFNALEIKDKEMIINSDNQAAIFNSENKNNKPKN